MYIEKNTETKTAHLPGWITGLIPLLAILLMLGLFVVINPLALFTNNLPPIETLSVERIEVVDGGFNVRVINSGPHPVQIAQVMVDDAYWQFQMEPTGTLARLGRATIHIPYHWIYSEPHFIRLVTDTGLNFDAEMPVATLTPRPGLRELAAMVCWALCRRDPGAAGVDVVPRHAGHGPPGGLAFGWA